MKKFGGIFSLLLFLVLPLAATTQQPIRVNVGGSAYTDTKGNLWSTDFGYNSGSLSSSTANATVTGTSDPKLFKTARFGDFQYQFAVANGSYQVNLYFAETYWTSAGKRVFNVQMQSANVIGCLDIYAAAGKNHALVKSATVTVSNGKLVIGLKHCPGKYNGILSALEVLPTGITATAPSITAQPVSQTVSAGQTATFGVTASGSSPFTYQWQKNGSSISGAKSSTYTTPATVTGDSGETFRVIVSNSKGSATSNSATLTVSSAVLPPVIIAQPVSVDVPAGQPASFAVVANGSTPLRYQWLKNGSAISGATNSSYTINSTSTSENGSAFSVVLSNPAGQKTSNAAMLTVSSGSGNAIVVNGLDVHQEIDGFGASSAATGDGITNAQADLFWSTSGNGVGLSLLRIQIQSDGTYPDLATMQKAQDRGVRIWGTPWSPPASMKSNGQVANGGYLLTADYQAYADYLTNYVKTLKNSYGFDLYALSVQNEPNWVANYDSCIWSGQQFHDFMVKLIPDFATHGLTTKIMLPEGTGWNFDLATATLNDPVTAAGSAIVAAHNYDGAKAAPYALGQSLGKKLWETEVSSGDAYTGGIDNGLTWAQKINDFMTIANANAWHYWVLVAGGSDNGALLGPSGQTTKRLFAMGNFSRFARPGYFRIGINSAPAAGVSLSAYKDPTNPGKFAVVAINHNGSPVTLKFALSGLTAGSVTPWVTDASRDLAPQSSIPVSGGTFTVVLPASSITTYAP